MNERRNRRAYTEKFKKQLVELLNNGKSCSEILREYDLTASSFDRWMKRINATGSSHDKDNRTSEEREHQLHGIQGRGHAHHYGFFSPTKKPVPQLERQTGASVPLSAGRNPGQLQSIPRFY